MHEHFDFIINPFKQLQFVGWKRTRFLHVLFFGKKHLLLLKFLL